jgi:cyclohexyl-isocyanide hydratase
VSLMFDRKTAEMIQLGMEYNPAPPFNAGSPDVAPAEVLASVNARIATTQPARSDAIHRAAARLA